jgi:hypothetical protein
MIDNKKRILKELDRHKLNSNIIRVIIDNIKTYDESCEFLNYLILNRNILLSKYEIVYNLKKIV